MPTPETQARAPERAKAFSKTTQSVIRTLVKAVLASGLVIATCFAVVFRPEVSGEGLALLGTLTGAAVTHYFQRDNDS